MKPVYFEEATHELKPPSGMSDDCGYLPVLKTDCGFSSCWELTDDEWLDIKNNGGKLWLTIYGQSQPPVLLSVEKPFEYVE